MYFQMLKYYCFVQSCHTYVCVYFDITCPYIWNQTCKYKPLYCRIWAVQCSYEKSASVSTGTFKVLVNEASSDTLIYSMRNIGFITPISLYVLEVPTTALQKHLLSYRLSVTLAVHCTEYMNNCKYLHYNDSILGEFAILTSRK